MSWGVGDDGLFVYLPDNLPGFVQGLRLGWQVRQGGRHGDVRLRGAVEGRLASTGTNNNMVIKTWAILLDSVIRDITTNEVFFFPAITLNSYFLVFIG